jgi:hypothetical protein
MADAADSKSVEVTLVRVQVSPSAQVEKRKPETFRALPVVTRLSLPGSLEALKVHVESRQSAARDRESARSLEGA